MILYTLWNISRIYQLFLEVVQWNPFSEQEKFFCDLWNKSRSPNSFLQWWSFDNTNYQTWPESIWRNCSETHFLNKVLCWPWNLVQDPQIPFCNGDPPNYAKYKLWSESIYWFGRNRSETHFLNNPSSAVTLKFRSRSSNPFCNGDPPNYAKYQTWPESIHWCLRYCSETHFYT